MAHLQNERPRLVHHYSPMPSRLALQPLGRGRRAEYARRQAGHNELVKVACWGREFGR